MDILFHESGGDPSQWLDALQTALPEARLRAWAPGDVAPADYALVWKPPLEVLQGRVGLKAVFNLGAGVDAILAFLAQHPQALPASVPLVRLEDAGMARQMVHYATHAVLGHFRDMDAYAAQQARSEWRRLPARRMEDHPVGVLGLGVLGGAVAQALVGLGFRVRGWSRSARGLPGVEVFAGAAALTDFAAGLQVAINLLPSTPETENILDARFFARLADGSRVVNLARGAHLVEADLLAGLAAGRPGSAVLDVFREEPLPAGHPFWLHPRVVVTPHVSALTLVSDSVAQIAAKIRALEAGGTISGVVERARGY